MTRARPAKAKQLSLMTNSGRLRKDGRGGARPGAGRPPKGKRAGAPHLKRPAVTRHEPVHVVSRVAPEVGRLRKRDVYRAVRRATVVAARRDDMRIVHASIQGTHLHLLVETDDERALASGMKGFQGSAAKAINRALSRRRGVRRRGPVFPDRYHAEVIRSPRQARHAIGYVINNWRKHGEHRRDHARAWTIDPFSSGVTFDGWREHGARGAPWTWPEGYEPLVVRAPRSWLLGVGWRRHGLISVTETPSVNSASSRRRRARQPEGDRMTEIVR